jgi:hypothetical protein
VSIVKGWTTRRIAPWWRIARGGVGADVLRLAGHRERSAAGRTGTAAGHMTIYAQMPDTLALNVKGQVRVADVTVGTVSYLLLPFTLSPQKGAATSVYLASSPEVKNISGKHLRAAGCGTRRPNSTRNTIENCFGI